MPVKFYRLTVLYTAIITTIILVLVIKGLV
jgi:hypothetical protein